MSDIDERTGELGGDDRAARLRALPQLQRLLETAEAARLIELYAREPTVAALRTVLDQARTSLRA